MVDNAPPDQQGLDSADAQADVLQAESEKARSKTDVESQDGSGDPQATKKQSAFKSLGWLDRYLAVWILLAIILGILLGNFAPHTAEALDRGRFVGVSVPIGAFYVPSF
jgi:arsenite transporter